MEITPVDDGSPNVVKESLSSKSSTVSEFEKDVGNAHILQKSASMEQEESSRMVSESMVQAENGLCTNENGLTKAEEGDENDNCVMSGNVKFGIDRQTSTTSLEEQQRESKAEALLSMLSRGDVGKRPHSMPANLTHLWQSLKISSELNRTFERQSSNEEAEYEEASGHKVNVDDGLRSRPVDLEKIFTPACDSGEITPSKNRKVYASSSFYGSNHPTMEEQVELARRISHSLSDISNRESKGQSMYVNRKKRSVKWVHEGEGQAEILENENLRPKENKPSLKLVMDPRGQVQDFASLKKQGLVIEPPMSPEVCFDLVRDLNAPRGKGAELFAKRRKKSEKWIVDESNVKTVETYQAGHTVGKLPPPSFLKDSTQRVENVQKMNQIQERFSLPRLKLIKSPWEAALEGSVESAFQEINSPRGVMMAPTPTTLRKLATPTPPLPPTNPSKEEIYKPKPPRAWNPQPTCKTFSSVKLDKIFAGSPKSPVSIAYHPDTNTISTEPVITENIPNIASQLASYEVFDKSILQDSKIRRPDQFLDYSSVQKEQKVESLEQSVQKEQNHEKVVSEMATIEKKEINIEKETVEVKTEHVEVDKEVEDLCEREFNELSLEYEQVAKPEIKKPAALVPGALPIFDPSSDFSAVKEEKEVIKSEIKKTYKKPPSLVPGAKPLFGGVVDFNFGNDSQDKPYEKIPVKSLINSFEQSTRPVLKIKQINESVASPSKQIEKSDVGESETHEKTQMEERRVETKQKEWSEEEIQKIEHHYHLEKMKKEIYDQQIQKYKEEMKALRKSEGAFVPIPAPTQTQNSQLYQPHKAQSHPQHLGGMQEKLPSRIEDEAAIMRHEPVAQSPSRLQQQNNFNTAPRGWQSSMSYYRPVTFNSNPAYTDF